MHFSVRQRMGFDSPFLATSGRHFKNSHKLSKPEKGHDKCWSAMGKRPIREPTVWVRMFAKPAIF
jgi:hypothetical protein